MTIIIVKQKWAVNRQLDYPLLGVERHGLSYEFGRPTLRITLRWTGRESCPRKARDRHDRRVDPAVRQDAVTPFAVANASG
jgi:hypothetical protein